MYRCCVGSFYIDMFWKCDASNVRGLGLTHVAIRVHLHAVFVVLRSLHCKKYKARHLSAKCHSAKMALTREVDFLCVEEVLPSFHSAPDNPP